MKTAEYRPTKTYTDVDRHNDIHTDACTVYIYWWQQWL